MLMPAIRAMPVGHLPLTLLVTRVLTDHEDRAMTADDLALLAHGLDRRSDLHAPRITFCIRKNRRKAQESAMRHQPRKDSSRSQAGWAAEAGARGALSASSRCHGVR